MIAGPYNPRLQRTKGSAALPRMSFGAYVAPSYGSAALRR